MREFIKSSAENKKVFKHCKVTDVKQFQFTNAEKKSTKALVLYVPYPFHTANQSSIRKLVNHFTSLRNQYTFVVAKRTTVHKRSTYNQKIPHSRTLTAVYDSILDDLLLPGFVIGKRMRVR